MHLRLSMIESIDPCETRSDRNHVVSLNQSKDFVLCYDPNKNLIGINKNIKNTSQKTAEPTNTR